MAVSIYYHTHSQAHTRIRKVVNGRFFPWDAVPGGDVSFAVVQWGMENLLVCVLCVMVCLCSLIPFQSAMTCSLACCPFVLLTLSLSPSCCVCVCVSFAVNECAWMCICEILISPRSRDKMPLNVRKAKRAPRQGRDKCEEKGWISDAEVAVQLNEWSMAYKGTHTYTHTSAAWTSHDCSSVIVVSSHLFWRIIFLKLVEPAAQ